MIPCVPDFTIREATEADVPQILRFIKDLAEYERLAHRVIATEERLRRTLFGNPRFAEVMLLEEEGEAAGFALFFHNYSTFLAQPGIFLEDLYVKPETRGRGYGRALLARLAKIAKDRDCGRLEWAVLDWNAPSIAFYKSLGAVPLDDWIIFRLTGEALDELSRASLPR
jgi:GNAT superfamily N-acetyltransferase